MATLEASASRSGSSFSPDSLPMGTDVLPWGQAAVRHLLPDRVRINEVLQLAGYHQPKVIDVVGGLLERVQTEPSSKGPAVWHYRPEGNDTGMAAHLYAGKNALVLTTTPHRNTGWEMQMGRIYDTDALAEYSGLYGKEKPGYKFKMVLYDPGPQGPTGPEGEEGEYSLDVLARASQVDRKLPLFGMKSRDWGLKTVASRWAVMYEAVPDEDWERGNWIKIRNGDGSQSDELYRPVQREQGKVHVAVRAVNVSPTGW